LKGDSPSADFCLATDKIMPENPYIHPMWTGSYIFPRGIVTLKLTFLSSHFTPMLPPCRSVIAFAIASPRP